MTKKIQYLILGGLIIAALLLMVFQKQLATKETTQSEAISVKAITAKVAENKNTIAYVGVLKGEMLSKLSFQVPGEIVSLLAESSTYVKKGQPLAEIKPNRLDLGIAASNSQISAASAQLSKAKEGYAFAQTQYDNVKALVDSGGASQNDLDKAKLSLDSARSDFLSAQDQVRLAELQGKESQLNLDDSVLLSPYDGYVVDWLSEIGEIVGAGYPVVVFRAPNQIVEIGISQKDYAFFQIGTQVTVIVDDRQYPGVVTQRDGYPNSVTRTFTVQVAIDQKDIPTGSLCRVEVEKDLIKGVRLPVMALIYNDRVQVYVVRDQTVTLIDVEVIALDNDHVIVTGIEDGTLVVTEGIKRLKPGDAVVLLP